MGNTSSSNPLEAFYIQYFGHNIHSASGGALNSLTAGGQSSYTGGYSKTEEYSGSVYSEAKEKLIRGIARDVSGMLRLPSGFADKADIHKVIENITKIVPNPRDDKKKLTKQSSVHTDLCKKLAESINKNYGTDIIDKNDAPGVICNKVAEILYSLFTGLHSEFLTVSGDVSRILGNLATLQNYVDSANEKLLSELSRTNSESIEVDNIKMLYKQLSEEIKRQQAILSNVTSSVIGPTNDALITILESNDGFEGLTADILKSVGTPEFSNKLGFVLSGTANVAHVAEIVDKALKKIGMSVAEYKNTKGTKDLRDKVFENISKQKPGSEELYKMLAAADLLYQNDYNHDDIVEFLNKKRGGMSGGALGPINEYDMSVTDNANINTISQENNDPFKGRTQSERTTISKQLNQKSILRRQIFSAFNDQVKERYNKIKYSLSTLGKKIGTEVKITPEFDMFIKQLNNFANSQPDKHNIHIALSGYRRDLNSQYVKYQFMENLEVLSEVLAPLTSGSGGHIFKEIKSNIDSLIDAVKRFNETFTGTLSDIHVSSLSSRKVKGGDCGCDGGCEKCSVGGTELSYDVLDQDTTVDVDESGVEGGGDQLESPSYNEGVYTRLGGLVKGMPDSAFNHFKSMNKAIREIDYFYRISGIKSELTKTSAEYDANTENYENILGEEAGFIINQVDWKYNALIKAIDKDDTSETNQNISKLYAGSHPVADTSSLKDRLGDELSFIKAKANPDDKRYLEECEGGYRFLLEFIRTSKIGMIEAAQALDLYLSKFTKEMQFKPDEIREFSQILEEMENVAKWFTEKSGDVLAGVFESFTKDRSSTEEFLSNGDIAVAYISDLRDYNAGEGNVNNNLSDGKYVIRGDHYYEDVKIKKGVGIFYRPRMMTREQAINFVKQIEKSVKGVRALENIILAFTRISGKASAGVVTFMPNDAIFKSFMNYCIASVISVGYLKTDKNGTVLPTFLNKLANNKIEKLRSVHAKLAVGLRFNCEAVPIKDNNLLELSDPLNTISDPSGEKHMDIFDKIFIMCIKSLVAKVFTVVGAYTLFNKPAKDQANPMSLPTNPLRQILGGGSSMQVNIIPDATELYFRLPLLAEWYRKVFEFNGSNTPDEYDIYINERQLNPIISVIPDMDGIWGALTKVIFLDAVNITDGAYPVDYANKIIEAINNIYRHYRSKSHSITCKEIISEFVLEINRRYGAIMREEIKRYLDERNDLKYDLDEYSQDDNVEYDLLDIESRVGMKPAPSDRFRTITKKNTTRAYSTEDLLRVVKRFRESIEANLYIPFPEGNRDQYFRNIAETSLSGIIDQTLTKVKGSDPAEQYKIIHEQLHGVEKFGDLDQQKLVLFHETVVTPLTTLFFTYLILNDFNKYFTSIDPTGGKGSLYANFLYKFKGDQNKFKSIAYNNTSVNSIVFSKAEYMSYERSDKMGDLLRKLMNIGCDLNNMTEVTFTGATSVNTYPILNYNKLQEVCFNLFNNAKSAFHQLRKYLPSNLVQQIEDIKSGNNENIVSMFYIQENLFDRLFANKFGNGLIDANISLKNVFLTLKEPDLVNNVANFSTTISSIGFWDANRANAIANPEPSLKITREFPYYYMTIFNSGGSLGAPKTKQERAVVSLDVVGLLDNAQSPVVNYAKNVSAMYLMDDNMLNDNHKYLGLIPKFNKLLVKYCEIFVDKATKKIYRPLLEKFVNGHNAKDIINAKNIDDTSPRLFTFEPARNSVIFASIASALKNIMISTSERVVGQQLTFLEDSYLNITEYHKELMRAHLPGFEKELNIIVKKAEFMRKCLEETNIKVSNEGIVVNAPALSADKTMFTQRLKSTGGEDPAARKSYLISIFDDLSTSAKSLLRCINDVQMELSDIPLYFETYKDSLVDYEKRNGFLPFAPLSNITSLMNFSALRDESVADKYNLSVIPQTSSMIGSSEFKMTYGTRGVLGTQDADIKFSPTVLSLLDTYNSKIKGGSEFDKSKMASITQEIILLSRWNVDFMYHKQVLDKCDWRFIEDLIGNVKLETPRLQNLSCQTGLSTSVPNYRNLPTNVSISTWNTNNIVMMAESDNNKQSLYRLVSCIVKNNTNRLLNSQRKYLRVYNILDLNIVPINVHAMQREMPFINIYNYSFTFDHMIKNFIGVATADAPVRFIKWNQPYDPGRKPEDTLVQNLIYPLGFRSNQDYVNNTYRIMSGNMQMALSRPKYLSDQLFNKVLLNKIYDKEDSLSKPPIYSARSIPYNTEPLQTNILSFVPSIENNLTYLKDRKIKVVDMGDNAHLYAYEGYLRYSSKTVRWQELFVQLQRVLRLLMRDQLSWVQDPVVQGSDAIAEEITEYTDDNNFTLDEFE